MKAKQLQKEFGCQSVVEEWNHGHELVPGALHLTNVPPTQFRNNKPALFKLVSRGWPSPT